LQGRIFCGPRGKRENLDLLLSHPNFGRVLVEVKWSKKTAASAHAAACADLGKYWESRAELGADMVGALGLNCSRVHLSLFNKRGEDAVLFENEALYAAPKRSGAGKRAEGIAVQAEATWREGNKAKTRGYVEKCKKGIQKK
jgi:hypothetical protein